MTDIDSIWQNTVRINRHKMLSGKIAADCAVIGAGMAGLLIAHRLQKEGLKTVVIDASRIGSGTTGFTTAKITSQHGLIYDKLIKTVGLKKAMMYYKSNKEAIDEFENVINKNSYDCDFLRLPSYIYAMEKGKDIKKEYQASRRIGIDAMLSTNTGLPFSPDSALKFENQAQFNPLKFINQISSGLTVYEDTKAEKVDNGRVYTKKGEISARHIVIATHYPFINAPGYYFLRQHQEKSYVIAIKDKTQLNGIFLGIDCGEYSLRRYGEYILVGGSDHRTGKNTKGGCYDRLYAFIKNYFPHAEFAGRWSNQDCMTHDKIPFIGNYSKAINNVYTATGFQKWGMTSAMTASLIISDLILGRSNAYEELYTPQRFNTIASAGMLLQDVGHSAAGLFCGLFAGKANRCSHLGCKLHINADDNTKECRCHGSCFAADGSVIFNPAGSGLHGSKSKGG